MRATLSGHSCDNTITNENFSDASYVLVGLNLKSFCSKFSISERQSARNVEPDDCLDNFHHFTTPTLPHLLALLTHQAPSFPPQNTSLLVIDSISTLFALAFPKTTETSDTQQTPIKKSDAAQWAAGRRWAVMGDLISKIGRVAATRNIAVLLTSQSTTRIRSETRAILHPAVSGTAWDSGISSRIILYRDWLFRAKMDSSSQGDCVSRTRFAGVVKAKGVSHEGVGRMTTFTIDKVNHMLRNARNCNAKRTRPGSERSQWIRQRPLPF